VPHAFLSDEWIEAAKAIRDKYRSEVPGNLPKVKMNQIITDVPFGDGTLHTHIDTSTGDLRIDHGHLPEASTTIVTDYATARSLLLDQDPAAAMAAFMAGKIKIQGDPTPLLAVQVAPDEVTKQVAREILAITV
jgi:hypothetical protein